MQLTFSFLLLSFAVATYARPIDSIPQARDELSSSIPKTAQASGSYVTLADRYVVQSMATELSSTATVPPSSSTAAAALSTQNTGRLVLSSATASALPSAGAVPNDSGMPLSKRLLQEAAQSLSNAAGDFQNATNSFEDEKHNYTQPFKDAGAAFHNATSDAQEGFENLGDGMKNGTANLANGVKNSAEDSVHGMENKATGVVNGVKEGAQGAANGAKSGWNNADADSSS
ncbi:hypothetical protein DFH05DRAFT_1491202 [Lentinula detonsa]|uniref:Uncharacterized protein n=1 Tax=Lentinula detonsa TaxID=2804962 RepID=A0A9W8P1B8_9AGAR|nr:hypothetical protein DFH05DRAFT_1491202 [Lentinula detonsa]